MSLKYYKQEIDRTYRVLGIAGFAQNIRDIDEWLRCNYITEQEAIKLRKYNLNHK